MRVCKHGCGVKLFGFSRANHASKVFEFKTQKVYFIYPFLRRLKLGKSLQRTCVNFSALKGLVRNQQGGGGGWKQRKGHNFLRLRKGRGHEKWDVKRGRVMQIQPVIMQRFTCRIKRKFFIWEKKEKNNNKEQRNIMDINCEVLLQEFNKHLLFIYYKAMLQSVIAFLL